ncbi:MAG: ketosteroid isomerase-related protein [Bdellovibrionia bacterium]
MAASAKTQEIIAQYYKAFNQKDRHLLLSLLSEDIIHDINQGPRHQGKESFVKFLDKMDNSYDETLEEMAIMVDSSGRRGAAEFMVLGTYLKTDGSLPPARGQKYKIPAGAFFEVDTENNKITRVTTYYNLPAWIEMVK